MIELKLKNNTPLSYPAFRNACCEALVGNRAFIDCDIVIADTYQEENALCIVLGDEKSGGCTTTLKGEITSIGVADNTAD